MADKQFHVITKTLDNIPRFLFWNIDEFILMVTPLLIGIIASNPLLMLSGLGLKMAYVRLKKRFFAGSIKLILYWYFPTKAFYCMGVFTSLPQSHVRFILL